MMSLGGTENWRSTYLHASSTELSDGAGSRIGSPKFDENIRLFSMLQSSVHGRSPPYRLSSQWSMSPESHNPSKRFHVLRAAAIAWIPVFHHAHKAVGASPGGDPLSSAPHAASSVRPTISLRPCEFVHR